LQAVAKHLQSTKARIPILSDEIKSKSKLLTPAIPPSNMQNPKPKPEERIIGNAITKEIN
jgi:hypothetical protein